MDHAVTGTEDTVDERCARCGARASVDAALVRLGATQVTVVSRYHRARIGRATAETANAFVCLEDGRILRGNGHSREEAIVNALESGGEFLS